VLPMWVQAVSCRACATDAGVGDIMLCECYRCGYKQQCWLNGVGGWSEKKSECERDSLKMEKGDRTYPEGPGGKTMLGNGTGVAEVNIANGKVRGRCRNCHGQTTVSGRVGGLGVSVISGEITKMDFGERSFLMRKSVT